MCGFYWATLYIVSCHQWRRNEINTAGMKLEAQWLNQSHRVLREGFTALPHQLVSLQERCDRASPVGSWAKPLSAFGKNSIVHFGFFRRAVLQNCVCTPHRCTIWCIYMPREIRLRKYAQLRICNQIQVKDFKWIETYRTLTINQQINLANYCGGEKKLSPPRFQHCGGKRPRCPRGSDAYACH